jgi:hypothetical protein
MSNPGGQQPRYSAPRGSHKHTCPKCSDQVYRVPRRLVDRFISLFVPVQRYKCHSAHCGWEGNMPRAPKADNQSTPPLGADQYQA